MSEAEEFSKGYINSEKNYGSNQETCKNELINRSITEKMNAQEANLNSNKIDSDSENDSSNDSSEDNIRSKADRNSKKEKRKNKKQKQKEKKRNKKKIEKEVKKEDKLKEALRKEEESQKEAEKLLKLDERKRPYNSMYSAKEPTDEEKEAFQMKRIREEDPMAQFMAK
jgi:pre-mRNA-processing factor SLU7